MASFRRFLEWYLGLAPAESGQGTHWRWSLEAPVVDSVALTFLLFAVILVAVSVIYWQAANRVSTRQRVVLLSLRLAILIVIAACALRISLAVDRTSRPWLALMIDRSASMAREDVQAPGLEGKTSRLSAVQGWLCGKDAAAIEELSQSYRLRVFEFSEDARELHSEEGGTARSDHDDLSSAIRALRADGPQTRPAAALATVLKEFRGAPPAAVLVLSDGVSSRGEGERLSAMAATAQAAAVPVWTVAVGSETSAADIDLREVLYDRVALVGDTVTFDVRAAASGLNSPSVELHLSTAAGELLDSIAAKVADDGTISGTLSTRPAAEGRQDFLIEAAPAPNETDLENNSRTASVQIRSRQIRVLYVERLPRWEFRHLKATLERDEAVELQTVLLDSDIDYVREDRTALTQPPTDAAELAGYDAIILGDVNPASLPGTFLDNLKTLVGRDGAGLILVAGDRFNPAAFAGTPLDALLPISVTSVEPSIGGRKDITPSVTDAGASHPLLRLDAETPDAAVKLPSLSWFSTGGALKPGATALAEAVIEGGARQPVLAVHRYGSGRVLWQGTDELWKWRRFREDAIYGRYWSQAVRWVSRSRLSTERFAGALRTDRRVYAPGAVVQVQLSASESAPLPVGASPELSLEQAEGDRRVITLESRPATPGRYETSLSGLRTGAYRLRWINAPEGETVEWEFRVDSSGGELQSVAADSGDLAKTAEITHGRFTAWEDVGGLIQELPTGRSVVTVRGTSVPVWSRWEAALLTCGLFCVEWFVRRSRRLV